MKVGDIVECIESDMWTRRENIRIGQQVKITNINGDGWFRLEGKHLNHNSKLFKLVKSEKEIIGYELVKDAPDALLGTKVELDGTYTCLVPYDDDSTRAEFPVKILTNREWFKPIYKPKKVRLENIGSNRMTIVVSKDEIYILNGKTIDARLLEDIYYYYKQIKDIGPYPFRLSDFEARIFLVGCKTQNNLVSLNEVKKVFDTYTALKVNSTE